MMLDDIECIGSAVCITEIELPLPQIVFSVYLLCVSFIL